MGPGTMSALVGANVRRYRTERGMTQERLAELLGEIGLPMSDAALSRLEMGLRAVTVDHLSAFAEVFDCAPADLLDAPTERTTLALPAVDGPRGELSPDMLAMLARVAVMAPGTQGTLDRIAAVGSAGLRAVLVQHVEPLMAALADEQSVTRGTGHGC